MKLPAIYRDAARREAARYGRAFHDRDDLPRKLWDGAVDLWVSFTETQCLGATQEERVFGLLLLAEILESAE